MLRKFTFTLAVAASITVLIPDSASAWGRFGGFGGFGARFGGSHFGGFGARPFGGSRVGGFGARPFGGSHLGGFGARPFGGSRVVGASLGGGPGNRATAFSRPTMQRPTAFTESPTARTRPTIQRPTTLAKPRPTESPTTLAKPQPTIPRPTMLAKRRPTQSPTTYTLATNKDPSSPLAANASKGNVSKITVSDVSHRYSENPVTRNPRYPANPGHTQSPGYSENPGRTQSPGYSENPGRTQSPGYSENPGRTQSPGYSENPGHTQSPRYPEIPTPPGPTTSTTRPPVVLVLPPPVNPSPRPGISDNTPPPVFAYEPEPSRPTRPPRPDYLPQRGGTTLGMGGGGGGPALPPQRRIAPPTQPPTGVAGQPPGRRRGSVPAIPANEERFVRDEVLVEFRPDVSPQAAFDIAMRERLTLIASQRLELIDSTINRYQILDGRSVPAVVAALASNPNIVSTQPNHLYSLQQEERGSPQEPYPRARMHLDAAHSISEGGGTLVAVIDTIIDSAHPEIAGSIADSVDLIRADPKPDVKGMATYENALVTMSGGSASEPYVHGTAIAGVIAAHGELTGVAPKARILAVRAFAPRSDERGAQGTTHNIVTGIDWAFKHGARVANLSFGGPRDELLSDALAIGVARGMIFVASVGNKGAEAPPLYPAADENVIAATASDEKDGIFKRANHCSLACVAAPGVDLRVSAPPTGYRTASGTSLAAAHIAGVVALVLDKRPDLEPRKVREALFGAAKRSSRSRPYPAETSIAGVVDAYETLEAALVEPKEPPAEVTSENSTHAPYIGVHTD
jgi:Subtilase family